jgi:hypothetical protein
LGSVEEEVALEEEGEVPKVSRRLHLKGAAGVVASNLSAGIEADMGTTEESSSVTPSYPRQSSAAIIIIASLTRRSGHPISSWYQITGFITASIFG